jgi:hypothetical protein
LAVDEVIVNSRAGLSSGSTFQRKSSGSTFQRKGFGIKIYKLCNELECTYDMRVYWGRDCHSTTDMTVTYAAVRHLTCRVESLGHKIFMDNFFSSPRLFDDLERYKINSCRTVQPSRRDMACDIGPK